MEAHKEEGDLPLLRLESWERIPDSHFSQFDSASLSCSGRRLAIHSHSGDLAIFPFRESDASSLSSSFSTSSGRMNSSAPHISACDPASESSFCHPIVSQIDCFTWGCQDDAYGVDGISGPFEDLLFTSGQFGLYIFGFVWKPDSTNGRSLHADSAGRGEDAMQNDNHGIEDRSTRETNDEDKTILKQKGNFSYSIVNTELESGSKGLKLKFPTSHLCPIVDVVLFSIPYDSPSFLRLVMFYKDKLSGKGPGEAQEDLEGSQIEMKGKTSNCKVTKLLSCSSHNLIAVMLQETDSATNWKNEIVVVASIHQWGLLWLSVLNLTDSTSNISHNPWVDIALAGDRLFGLKEDGTISVWGAITMEHVVKIDVVLHSQIQLTEDKLKDEGSTVDHYDEPVERQLSLRFDRMVVSEDCLLLAVSTLKGQVYLVPVDELFSRTNHVVETIYQSQDLQVSSVWELAGLDVGKLLPYNSLPNRYWLSNLNKAEINPNDEYTKKYSNMGKPKWHFGGSKQSHQYSDSGFSMNSTQFTEHKSSLLSTETSKPFRRVMLPYERVGHVQLMAINSYCIAEVVSDLENSGHFTVIQNLLRVCHGSCMEPQNEVQCCTPKHRKFTGNAIHFCFQGLLYLVFPDGLHVVLPPLTVPSRNVGKNTSQARWWLMDGSSVLYAFENHSHDRVVSSPSQQWEISILDRALVYDGLREAEHLCLQNGWSIQQLRLRRLQMALYHVRIDEIEQLLESLEEVGAAEAGIPRVLFTVVELMLNQFGTDNELAQAARLLLLCARFITRLIHHRALMELQHKLSLGKHVNALNNGNHPPKFMPEISRWTNSVGDLSLFLETIRKLQFQLDALRNGRKRGKENAGSEIFERPANHIESLNLKQSSLEGEEANPAVLATSSNILGIVDAPNVRSWDIDISGHVDAESSRKSLLEDPKEMFARWENENVGIAGIVRDALRCGRIPLAVVHLHRERRRAYTGEEDEEDIFNEVQQVGRSIVYELLFKGKFTIALAALRRLGEDVEVALHEFALGSVNRFLRNEAARELQKHNRLSLNDTALLRTISLLEAALPSSSFWSSYSAKQNLVRASLSPKPTEECNKLRIFQISRGSEEIIIECGEVDGVVLGSWSMIDHKEVSSDTTSQTEGSYWAGAAIWLQDWDTETIDKILLEQHVSEDIHWQTCFDYYVIRHSWHTVCTMLEEVPNEVLCKRQLQVCLDVAEQDYEKDLNAIGTIIPDVQYFQINTTKCTSWLWNLIETSLARKSIFLRLCWVGTAEIIALLARGHFLSSTSRIQNIEGIGTSFASPGSINNTVKATYELVAQHSVRNNLAHFLELYLDHHSLGVNKDFAFIMESIMEDCDWALWLLLSRIKGREYDASFANARTILKPGFMHSSASFNGFLPTIDDMAEAGTEIMALCTLIYAPIPPQKCLCTGSINKDGGPSWRCTLENLQPGLQGYPTLWHTLVSSCAGKDRWNFCSGLHNGSEYSSLSLTGYVRWRDTLFSSASGDTNLMLMAPQWLPKGYRRLLQLSIQDPIGGSQISDPLSWEMAVQKNIEEELYTHSSEDSAFGVEHYLRRGRPLAAFNSFLTIRIRNHGPSLGGGAKSLQNTHRLMSSLTEDEQKPLLSVLPLAITNFGNAVVVAACASFLELCGLSANMLRIDVASLLRISMFQRACQNKDQATISIDSKTAAAGANTYEEALSQTLAQTLADEYLQQGIDLLSSFSKESRVLSGMSNKTLLAVLQQLERASLTEETGNITCGSWLANGIGDGVQLRAAQRAASERWSLVTSFCRVHHIPLSTTYLCHLARDNDWVGFLAEAQAEARSLDTVTMLVSKHFTDLRVKSHILTTLKSFPSARTKSSTAELSMSPPVNLDGNVSTNELFTLLADIEHCQKPGGALLEKAKDLRWPLLAVLASSFSDVSSLSCLTIWLEITAARETSSIKVSDASSQIAENVGAAVLATNSPSSGGTPPFRYNRKSPKRRRQMLLEDDRDESAPSIKNDGVFNESNIYQPFTSVEALGSVKDVTSQTEQVRLIGRESRSLANMVAILCKQKKFLPLLKAFELFLPSSSLLHFVRFLQAFSQMRLTEASAHLQVFSTFLKEELQVKGNKSTNAWISMTAIAAADAVLDVCPSSYERQHMLQLLTAAEFGDGGATATRFRRLYWKMRLADPALRPRSVPQIEGINLSDEDLLAALENNGMWDEARSWAIQLDLSRHENTSLAVHHVTEMQAEALVAEWKELLWDIPEQRGALWSHCQTLFTKHSFPPKKSGMFFLKHAQQVEHQITAAELHGVFLLALQWLSGSITKTEPEYPMHLLRELETRVWLLAVESEIELQSGRTKSFTGFVQPSVEALPHEIPLNLRSALAPVDQTASSVAIVDRHLGAFRDSEQGVEPVLPSHDKNLQKQRRRVKSHLRRAHMDNVVAEIDDALHKFPEKEIMKEAVHVEEPVTSWDEKVGEGDVDQAVLALLEVGQVAAAKQLQQKLSPNCTSIEILIAETARNIASSSTPTLKGSVVASLIPQAVEECLAALGLDLSSSSPLQVLEALTLASRENCGRGLCRRITAIAQIANFLELPFEEAFQKQAMELLQLLSFKGQDALTEARLLVATHAINPATIARILAESFLKGLLAAHRGGYMESSLKEEGPAPLLWRPSDFIKWAQLCPSEPELGHALMRLIISGHDMPHACEVELMILAHQFYDLSACLDGMDVLVALAATRVEAYVAEGDFIALARLVTGVSNFQALRFVLDLLVENGQLELLLLKRRAAVDSTKESSASTRDFRMAILSALKLFNPQDLDAFAAVYRDFKMAHEMAVLLESRGKKGLEHWVAQRDQDNEELLEIMRFFVEASEVYAGIDCGNKTRWCCAQSSLISLQLRIPEKVWLNLTETNARRLFVEQHRFQEALIVAEAYRLNQPAEWVPVLWNQIPKVGWIEQFLREYVASLPLPAVMLLELARFYRAEATARGVQHVDFANWLTVGAGMPAEFTKSFRCILGYVRDVRLRIQLATTATSFPEVVESCMKILDKVPDTAGPLVLKKGHGGTYVPLL